MPSWLQSIDRGHAHKPTPKATRVSGLLWPRRGIEATLAGTDVAEAKTEKTGLEADGATIRTTGAAPSEAIGSKWSR